MRHGDTTCAAQYLKQGVAVAENVHGSLQDHAEERRALAKCSTVRPDDSVDCTFEMQTRWTIMNTLHARGPTMITEDAASLLDDSELLQIQGELEVLQERLWRAVAVAVQARTQLPYRDPVAMVSELRNAVGAAMKQQLVSGFRHMIQVEFNENQVTVKITALEMNP